MGMQSLQFGVYCCRNYLNSLKSIVPQNDTSHEPKWLVPLLLILGLAFRIIYYFQYAASPFWGDLSIDEQLHHAWAIYISDGNIWGDSAFFRAPLYPYFLGLLYAITGISISAVMIVQHLIGLATGWIIYRTAREMFSYTTAVLSLMIYTVTPVFIYFEGQLLLDFLILPLSMTAMLFGFRAIKRSTFLDAGLSALFFGLSALTRPNVLVFVPVIVLIIGFYLNKSIGLKRSFLRVALFCLVIVLTIAPVTIRNYIMSGDVTLISSQGGINFYLGNNEEADGVSAYMPGLGFAWEYDDCVAIAEDAEGRALSDAEVSSYWYDRGMKFILDKPDRFAPLIIKKAYLLLNNNELSNNRNIPFVYSQAWLLSVLPVGMWLLLPMAIIGAVSRRKQLGTLLIAAFTVTYALTILMFFINSRFRLPVLIGMIILSALGIEAIVSAFSARTWKRIAFAAPLAIIISAFTLGNAYNLDLKDISQEEYNLGNFHMKSGRFDEALTHYHQALDRNPSMNLVNLNIGTVKLRSGEPDSARYYFGRELDVALDSTKAYNNLSVLERLQGNDSLALLYAMETVRRKPYFSDGVINFVLAARNRGDYASSLAVLDSLIRVRQSDADAYYYRGVMKFDIGQLEEASVDFSTALRLLDKRSQPSFATSAELVPPEEKLRKKAETKALIHYHLGTIAGRTGRLADAERDLLTALAIDPKLVEARINLVTAQVQLGKFDTALSTAESLINDGLGSNLVWYLHAVINLNLGNADKALASTDSSLSRSPNFAPAVNLRNQLLQRETGENQSLPLISD